MDRSLNQLRDVVDQEKKISLFALSTIYEVQFQKKKLLMRFFPKKKKTIDEVLRHDTIDGFLGLKDRKKYLRRNSRFPLVLIRFPHKGQTPGWLNPWIAPRPFPNASVSLSGPLLN